MGADTVLIIEDEPDIRALLRVLLTKAGLEAVQAGAAREGLRLLHEVRPDLVVLDIGLPDLDGWAVIERIRDLSDVPVLMLTARGQEAEKVRGLSSGADDYVTKPFGNAELVARIQALLRRSARAPTAPSPTRFDDGWLRVDLDARSVHVSGEAVELTPLEYRVLTALVAHAGRILSPQQLLSLAWDDDLGIGPDRVKFTVSRLRRKLGNGAAASRIEAVRGFGYRYRTAG
ncbi:MAG TPA: response regulator transcription factor [Euzebyales bacterium]|nr:response regulator transcription factor [Euzebyales bacterium]